ncbi:MAG: outer membrane lipoprotein LolB [Nitrosospira sp.]|nr:outer membrane lipoprotein LolB [Nitrosospira sp.]
MSHSDGRSIWQEIWSLLHNACNPSFLSCQLLFWAITPLLLSCTTLTPRLPIAHTILIKPTVSMAHENFELVGKILVKNSGKSFHGRFFWRHDEINDEILILSPLGQVVAKIQRNDSGAYLTTSEQDTLHAVDVESLTERFLGWQLPITSLQYWIRGINSPITISEIDMGADKSIMAIRQDDWEITYLDYSSLKLTQIARPRILVLNRTNLQIKLIIDN